MTCTNTSELLPFLLNGSLEPEERLRVREHLRACGDCRQDLAAAAWVWAAHQTHPPADAVADYGLGLDVSEFPRDLLERHLASCRSCQEDLALLGEESAEVIPFEAGPEAERRRSVVRGWQSLALAASVLTLLSSGTLLLRMQTAEPGLRGNLAVVELLPTQSRFRGADSEVSGVDRGEQVAVVLVPAGTPRGPRYQAILFDQDDREIDRVEGLELTATGDFTLLLQTRTIDASAVRSRHASIQRKRRDTDR